MKEERGFLKEKMHDYRVDPPTEVWQSVEAGIRRKGRRRLIIFSLAAAASLALAISLGIRIYTSNISGDQENVFSQKEASVAGEKEPVDLSRREAVKEGIQKTDQADQLPETIDLQPVKPHPHEKVTSKTPPEDLQHKERRFANQAEPDDPGIYPSDPGISGKDDLADHAVTAEHQENTARIRELTSLQDSLNTDEQVVQKESIAQLQEDDQSGMFHEDKTRDRRWILGALVSPLYSYRDATDNALTGALGQESGVISYAGGVQVAYRTSRRLAIETGVLFNKMGLEISSSGILHPAIDLENMPVGSDRYDQEVKAVSNSVGNIVSNEGEIFVNHYKLNAAHGKETADNLFGGVQSFDGQNIEQHLDYLEIPLNVRYTLIDRSLKLQLMGGFSTNLLVNNYVTMEGPEEQVEIGFLSNVRSVNYAGSAGIGVVYHLFSDLFISLEPGFRYYLNSVNDQTLPSTRPFSFGLYTGLSYTF